MTIDRRRLLRAITLLAVAIGPCGLLIAAPTLAGDSWPSTTVKVIVPYPAGGSTDVLARILCAKLSDTLGQSFIVENRAGANGNLGAAVVASARPDGYTLLFTTTGPLVFNKLIYKAMPFDPARDFAPIVEVSAMPLVVAANSTIPVTTISDLVAYAKANPGKVTYATGGRGSMGHLTAELLQRELGIRMTHIPYTGSAKAVNDLLGERVNLSFDLLPTYAPHIQNRTLKALAVTTLKRVPDFPEVATLVEQGVPKFEAVGWTALVGPAHLAPETVEKLNHIINDFIASDEGRSALAKLGMEARGGTPQDLADYMASELVRWQPVAEKVKVE